MKNQTGLFGRGLLGFAGTFSLLALVGCTSSPSRTVTGTAGSGGTAGASGSAGATGSAGGTAGATGGSAGAIGSAGVSGGTAGVTGSAGASGSAGVTGSAGVSGGSAGATGSAGAGTDGGSNTDAIVAVDGPNQVPSTYTGRPLGGMPQTIPGTIQVENYDTGGPGVAYNYGGTGHGSLCGVTRTDLVNLNCTGQAGSPTDQTEGTCAKLMGDVYLGYIDAGDWLNYTVTVQEAGTYAISTHAGVEGTPKLMFTFTPTVKTAALPLMGTSGCGVESYHVWAVQNDVGTIALTPGTYVMRLDFVAVGLNLDWVAFTKM
ncbi:MAG TPA: carbohydrate-binding protein [Polyangia bacterium]|jgi:hypothetical protein|nr:carbohydrate-binding protein [Polyangia bacterium]